MKDIINLEEHIVITNEGVSLLNWEVHLHLNDWLNIEGPGAFSEEGHKIFSQWCKENDVYYYSRPYKYWDEDVQEWAYHSVDEAQKKAKAFGRRFLLISTAS